jgi:hypothetical protein
MFVSLSEHTKGCLLSICPILISLEGIDTVSVYVRHLQLPHLPG